LKAPANLVSISTTIQQVLNATPSPIMFPGGVASVRPLLDTTKRDKWGVALYRAGQWLLPAAVAGLAVVVFALVWARFRALNLELALRRSFGQQKRVAVWFTMLPDCVAIASSVVFACAVAGVWLAYQGWSSLILPTVAAATLGVGLGIALCLGMARLRLNPSSALLLKTQLS
jgi:hypothetical protein